MKPKRIQRQRTKGWRMPENTVYVGRPSKWGNPFVVGDFYRTRGSAVTAYSAHVSGRIAFDQTFKRELKRELGGKDLACWCPLDEPCHADVLLKWANS